ncbi:hypothetical protein KKD19_03630 [Patescibacteria group bacterium]|nr:hypothetical protein [Patescibacteria group bacterium]MBU4512303.1 hypothetical protein [Patescibacteria group bacterium]MCG2692754.1 hypothetical protein [Candidatus Parcubacteria bacterium]
MKRIHIKIILIILSFSLIPCLTFARESIFKQEEINSIEQAQEIAEPRHRTMIYGQVEEPGVPDFYKFTFPKDITLPIEVLVPLKEKYKDFRPSLIIIGPNFIENKAPLPFLIPEGSRAVILEGAQAKYEEIFKDKFTLTSYAIRTRSEIDFVKNRPYFLAVFDERGQTGMYVIKIGQEEIWGAQQVIDTSRALIRMNLGRASTLKTVGIVMAFVLAVLVVIVRLRGPKKTEDEKFEEEI